MAKQKESVIRRLQKFLQEEERRFNKPTQRTLTPKEALSSLKNQRDRGMEQPKPKSFGDFAKQKKINERKKADAKRIKDIEREERAKKEKSGKTKLISVKKGGLIKKKKVAKKKVAKKKVVKKKTKRR